MTNDFLDNIANDQHQKMLREIAHEDLETVWKQMDEIETINSCKPKRKKRLNY